MKANELRIGNWVFLKSKNEPYEIWSGHDIEEVQDAPEMFDAVPISITEEWLLKFGFEGPKESGGTYYTLQSNRVYLFNDGFEFEISTSEFSRANLFRTYKYVHQLQNLYFALTGEELTINESTN